MHRLLYYPNFEIQDQNFLKFALLYIDEIRPIIPDRIIESLSYSMQNILSDTDLINPYAPNCENGYLASIATIKYLEEKTKYDRYGEALQRRDFVKYNYTLYSDKYTYEFENYCLENNLGERCNEGILLSEDVAYAYMSILAEIISKETETDMITDMAKYSDPVIRRPDRISRSIIDRLGTIQREIQFYVPVDMYRIPLQEFIKLRSDYKFETARRNFVAELNAVLDSYDTNVLEVDLYNVMECKQEIYGLLKKVFVSFAVVIAGVHSFRNMCAAETGTLDFWTNVGSIGINAGTLKNNCYEAREYAKRIERKRQARKYLAKLNQLRGEIL